MNSVQIPHNDAVFIAGATIFFVSIISYLIYNYSTNNSYEYFTCESEKDVVEYDDNQELDEDQEVNYENQELDEDQENPEEDYDYSTEEDYDYSTEEYESSDEDFNTDDCESESSSSDEDDDSIAYRRNPRKKRCFHYIERKNRYCKKTPLFGSNYCSCHQL